MADSNVRVKITGQNDAKPAIDGAKSELLGLNEVCGKVGSALKALGSLYVAERLFEVAKRSIEASAEMAHMSEKTGIAVDDLSALTQVARLADLNIDSFEKRLGKLASTLSDAAAGDQKAVDTLRSVGITARDAAGKTISLSEAWVQLSRRLQEYKDGTEKLAFARRAFGRGGEDMIPALNLPADKVKEWIDQLRAFGAVMTKEDAVAAEELEQRMKLLDMAGEALVRNLLAGMMPALLNVASALVSGTGDMNAMREVGELLGDVVKGIATVFLAIGVSIEWAGAKLKTFAEGMANLASGDFSAAKESLKEFFGFSNDSFAELARNQWTKGMDAIWGKHPIGLPEGTGGREIKRFNEEADKLSKLRMKQQMENEKLAAEFSKSINDVQLKQLEDQYKLMLIPVQEYFAKKKALEQDSLNAEIWSTKQELAVQEDWAKKAGKPEDRIAAQTKINELTERLTVLQAQLNALQGKNLGGEPDPMLKRVQDMEQAAAEAQRVGQQIEQVYADLQIAEQRVQLQVDTYKLTGTEAEKQLNVLRAEAAAKVAGITARYEELAKASGDPKLIQNAKEMQLRLDQLRVASNQLRDAVVQGLTSGFEGFFQTMQQTGDAEKSFLSFLGNIGSAIERVIDQMIAMAFVQKMLGFASGFLAGPSISASSIPSSSVTPSLTTAFAPSGLPGFAGGGNVIADQPVIVGEEGPELWVPDTAGRIIPNDAFARGSGRPPQANVHVTVVNQGAPKSAQATQPQWNEQLKQWHIQVHMDDMTNNGPLSRGMTGAFGG